MIIKLKKIKQKIKLNKKNTAILNNFITIKYNY